ncbi:EAL and HDOD domain-containing protein [Marinomonas transparens]|uniref:HDOD domain-containing protein n=1 Tax=Marinomonas transparens TaxID=2795388 RepID=A0A934JQH6_9GAMM|nr:HDOD domain-containing protein [Marinomonas transparens]MBJ7536537.1 HDOD domain-containing protein [Marinomonas transparens]
MIEFPEALDDLMMAQQPILTKEKALFGYELLFREKDTSDANVFDGTAATSRVLANLCIGITGMESQVKKPFFINMTTDLIVSDAFVPIDPESVYIEILEGQKLTSEFIESVKTLHSTGYLFALDDYQFSDEYKVLLPWVSIIKVDVLATNPIRYAKQLAELKSQGFTLLAEKVENQTMFDLCYKMGFELFQGYFLQRPQMVKGKKIDAATQGAMSLVNALQDEDVSISKVTTLVAQNPTISFQLLRILNSPVCGISKKVTSIKEAVVLVGLSQLKKWALLITLTSSSGQPGPLLKILLARGRCCQLLAEHKFPELSDPAFMTGLLSGIDAVFEVDKSEVFSQLALKKDIKHAILHGSGTLGELLKQTLSCEEQKWSKLDALEQDDRQTLNQAFLSSIIWADEVISSIAS